MENCENKACVKAEDVKKVLKAEGIETEALEALSGKELTDEDLKKLVGGLGLTELKHYAVTGIKYTALAAAGLLAVDNIQAAVRETDTFAKQGADKIRDFFK